MVLRSIIGLLIASTPVAAVSEDAANDMPRAAIFADSVWAYVSETCPVATSMNTEVNNEIISVLALPFNPHEDLSVDDRQHEWRIEALGKDLGAEELSVLDRRAFAQAAIGAYAVVQQLTFMNAVDDANHLATDGYLSVEAEMKERADASLALMECIWPTTEEVTQLSFGSAMGLVGDAMAHGIKTSLFEGTCQIDFITLAKSYLATDFAAVHPEAREEVAGEIMRSHDEYLQANPASERCEDFS